MYMYIEKKPIDIVSDWLNNSQGTNHTIYYLTFTVNNSQGTNHTIYYLTFTVYLQTKPETVHKRIRERDRKEELNISMVRQCH